MKNLYSFSEFINESIPTNYGEIENYMVIGNLEAIKKNVDYLLSINPMQMDEMIKDGHDWAEDHISVANENLDQVAHFFNNTSEGAKRLAPAEKAAAEKEAEMKLREKIERLMNKMKTRPETADITKTEIGLIKAKLSVISFQRELRSKKETM